jgi:glycosyltransferase involved in cell wall biosynthesis
LIKYPLVSIGVPIFNGEKWVRRALDSLLRQEYPNLEIMISENASNDDTYSICLEYAAQHNNIILIRQEKNISIAENFNAVLKPANGKYFMWAAVDDSWDKSFIGKLVNKLESNDSFSAVQSATMNISESDFEVIGYVRFNGAKNPEKCSMLQLTNKIVSPLKYNLYIYGLFRRELLAEAFKYFPSVPSSDSWFLLQFPLAGYKLAYLDEPLYIRTIAIDPVYVRYKNEDLGRQIKLKENVWFRFEALPAVKKMLSDSTMTSGVSKSIILIVMLQLFIGRIKIGFRLMTGFVLVNLVKPMMIKFLPSQIASLILKKWKRYIHDRNIRY